MDTYRKEVFETTSDKDVPFYDDVSWTAARLLKVRMTAIVKASQQLWGRPLSEERNDLLAQEHLDHLDHLSLRQQQAKRGHITRKLLDQLRPLVKRAARRTRKVPKRPK